MSKTNDYLDKFESPYSKLAAAIFVIGMKIVQWMIIFHFVVKYW